MSISDSMRWLDRSHTIVWIVIASIMMQVSAVWGATGMRSENFRLTYLVTTAGAEHMQSARFGLTSTLSFVERVESRSERYRLGPAWPPNDRAPGDWRSASDWPT